jgi:hypothetical protein
VIRTARRASGSRAKEAAEKVIFRVGIKPQGLKRLCRNCAAAKRLDYFSHSTAGLRPRLTQMPPLRGWFEYLSHRFAHRKILLSVATQSLKPATYSCHVTA